MRRAEKAEGRVEELEDRIDKLEDANEDLQDKVEELKEKVASGDALREAALRVLEVLGVSEQEVDIAASHVDPATTILRSHTLRLDA